MIDGGRVDRRVLPAHSGDPSARTFREFEGRAVSRNSAFRVAGMRFQSRLSNLEPQRVHSSFRAYAQGLEFRKPDSEAGPREPA